MTAAGYLPYLAATILLEVPLAVALAPAGARRRVALDDLLLNVLTHPLATLAYAFARLPLLPVEVGVWAVEAAGLRLVTRLSPGRAALVSLACNGLTTAVALALRP